MTDADIIKAYEAAESNLGRLAYRIDPKAICERVADDYGLTYQRVRDVMSSHWSGLLG